MKNITGRLAVLYKELSEHLIAIGYTKFSDNSFHKKILDVTPITKLIFVYNIDNEYLLINGYFPTKNRSYQNIKVYNGLDLDNFLTLNIL